MESFLSTLLETQLWGSVWYFYILTLAYIISLIISEKEEDGSISFLATLVYFGILSKFTVLDVSFLLSWKLWLIYLGIGTIYMFLRVYLIGVDMGKKTTSARLMEDPDFRRNKYNFYDVKYKAIRWWFMWPTSIVKWLFSDIIKRVSIGIYNKIESLSYLVFSKGIEKGSSLNSEE